MNMPTLEDFHLARAAARHEQITAFLREQVLSGALPPEARLPTTQELAKRWGVPIATIQAAFVPLVKEGLLLRRPGFGTVVRGPAPALTRVAIYQPIDQAWDGSDRFAYRLADSVESRLAGDGLEGQRVCDRRPVAERVEPLPGLLQAARARQIDAVIATETDRRTTPWLERLPVPTAIFGSGHGAGQVWFDLTDFAAQGLASLADRGCHRVGLITVLRPDQASADGTRSVAGDLRAAFLEGSARHGLETRPEWIRSPAPQEEVSERDAERFGYEQAQALCSGADRPDGLLVYTDRVARGVVMALLAQVVPIALPRLVLHRNAELGLFCPLPADFLESSAMSMADALVAVIRAQHQGRPLPGGLLPFRLVRG